MNGESNHLYERNCSSTLRRHIEAPISKWVQYSSRFRSFNRETYIRDLSHSGMPDYPPVCRRSTQNHNVEDPKGKYEAPCDELLFNYLHNPRHLVTEHKESRFDRRLLSEEPRPLFRMLHKMLLPEQ